MLPQPQQILIGVFYVGSRGMDAALVNGLGEVEWSEAKVLGEPELYEGFWGQRFEGIQKAFWELCKALGQARKERPLKGIALATPAQTMLLLGSENRLLTPVLFGQGVSVPGRAVPADMVQDAVATAFFRRSPLRQLAQRVPELAVEVKRVASLDAALCHELTRQWVATAACAPTGFPYDTQRAQHIDSEGFWAAAGVHPSIAPLLVPAGGVQGQVSVECAQATGLPVHCPLLSVGCDLGALASGVEAHPRRWLVTLSEGMQLAWTGPAPAPDRQPWWMPEPTEIYFQIQENGAVTQGLPPDPHMPEEALRMADLVSWHPGPGAQNATFKAQAALDFGQHPWIKQALADASRAPAGCDGLRFLPGPHTGNFLGLRPHHAPHHLGRAVIEGFALELHRWASVGFDGGEAQPIRLVLSDAWPEITAQIFADVLEGPVLAFSANQANQLRLVGLGLSALTALGLPTPNAWPSPHPRLFEPSPQSLLYRPLQSLHARLMDTAHPLLS